MLTAEQAGLPEIDYLAESQPDPTLTTHISDLVEATLRTVPDVGETPAVQLAPEELGKPLATEANKSRRPAKLVGLVAALATGASLVSACGPGYTETVDCTKVRRLDSPNVHINPGDDPAKVAIKTKNGLKDIAVFKKTTKGYEYRGLEEPEQKGSYQLVPKGKQKINEVTVIGNGKKRPEVVCPQ